MMPDNRDPYIYDALCSVAQKFEDAAHELRSLAGLFTEPKVTNTGVVLCQSITETVLNKNIDEFEFSVRISNCLHKAGIHTIQGLANQTKVGLLKLPHFGRKSRNEVIEVLDNIGISLPHG